MSFFFFFSSRRRHTRFDCDWSSDVCSSDLPSRPSCALPHALIVSADLGLRASLAVALRTRGRVDAVEDAGAALAVLARTRPSVVVVSEDAVATAVRGQWPAAPIVVTDPRRPDFETLLPAIIQAFGVGHADVPHFPGPVPP